MEPRGGKPHAKGATDLHYLVQPSQQPWAVGRGQFSLVLRGTSVRLSN